MQPQEPGAGQGHTVDMSFETLMAPSVTSAKPRKKNTASASAKRDEDMYEEYAKMVADFKAKQETEAASRRLQVIFFYLVNLRRVNRKSSLHVSGVRVRNREGADSVVS